MSRPPSSSSAAAPREVGPDGVTTCVFAWNEAATVEGVVHEIAAALGRLAVPFEIVVIDDGSVDGTSEIADRLAAEVEGVRVVHHGANRGLGAVYRTGFEAARGTYLTFFPADGQFAATILEDFYPRMGGLDLCLGYVPNRTDLVGRALSAAERVLYRALLGPMPRFQGVFMIRRRLLDEIPLASRGRGWAIVMELVIRASRRGYRIASVPTTLRPRTSGISKVNNWRSIQANLKQLVVLRSMIPRDG